MTDSLENSPYAEVVKYIECVQIAMFYALADRVYELELRGADSAAVESDTQRLKIQVARAALTALLEQIDSASAAR